MLKLLTGELSSNPLLPLPLLPASTAIDRESNYRPRFSGNFTGAFTAVELSPR